MANYGEDVKVVPISNLVMDQDRQISPNSSEMKKISFINGQDKLSIFGYQDFNNYNFFDGRGRFPTISFLKGNYKDLKFHIASEESNTTPWGYEVTIPQLNLDQDKQLNFTTEMQGNIEKVELEPEPYYGYQMNVEYSLTSGDVQVEGIHRAVENNHLRTFAALKRDRTNA